MKPVQTYRAGSIAAKIWENQVLKKDGSTAVFHTISLDRSYQDANVFVVRDSGDRSRQVVEVTDRLLIGVEGTGITTLPALQIRERHAAERLSVEPHRKVLLCRQQRRVMLQGAAERGGRRV